MSDGWNSDKCLPQILNEIVEVVKAVKTVPQDRISEEVGEQIDDDIPSINEAAKLAAIHRPVVMQRKVPQIRTVLKTMEIPPAKFVDRVVDWPEPCRVMTAVKRVIVTPTGAPSLMD